MHLKSLLAATVLLLVPSFGFADAGCPRGDIDTQAMSCVMGTQWDAETGACVPLTTS